MDNIDWVGLFQERLDGTEVEYVDSLPPPPKKPVRGFERKLWNRKVKGQGTLFEDGDDGRRTEYDH